MIQLAIEIGIDNVRAAIRKGNEYEIVSLGLFGAPYTFPPIGLRSLSGYIFGQVAKVNAMSRPHETIFLSDYTQKGLIAKEAMVAFVGYLCQKIKSIYIEDVDEITFIIPPYCNNSTVQSFLDECVIALGRKPLQTKDPVLSFVRSNFNVAIGDKLLIIDLRDCPSYIAVVSRTAQSYGTLGCIDISDFSMKDCENMIEETILSCQGIDLEMSDNVVSDWIQSEISTSLSQYGLSELIAGRDAVIPVPSSKQNCEIKQDAFQNWIGTKIDKVWEHALSLLQNLSIPPSQINQVAMVGAISQYECLRERFKQNFRGYNCPQKIAVFSHPNHEWIMCFSSLKMNCQLSKYALKNL